MSGEEQLAEGPSTGTDATRPRRRRNAQATRQALLEAASRRFVTDGYERTTLRDVAADVGVDVALIKRYFESKDGLFDAALASTPQFLGDAEGRPSDLETLTGMFSRQVAARAWSGGGGSPILMHVRTPHPDGADRRRIASFAAMTDNVLAAAGAGESDARSPDIKLRALLLIALGVGLAVLRQNVGLKRLRDAPPDVLEGPLRDVILALLAPDDDHPA
jgi:AcrR family transcriptional regulator